MKLYISADIEGTTGITLWDETNNGHSRYPYFAEQMSREVAAACEGAMDAGFGDILVKDAHDSACNIQPELLPEDVLLFRGWASDPLCMVAGLTAGYDGIVFTGYHSARGTNFNPLAHTMDLQSNYIKINGEIASELMISALAAAQLGVPVYCVTGDKGLCDWIRSVNPNIETVAVNEGVGNGCISIHPRKALRLIREAVARGVQKPKADCMYPLPAHFDVEVNFREHARAKSAGHYPGCVQLDPTTVRFASDDYSEVLQFFHWVL